MKAKQFGAQNDVDSVRQSAGLRCVMCELPTAIRHKSSMSYLILFGITRSVDAIYFRGFNVTRI